MTASDLCIACAGLDYPCETCGLLIKWNESGTCEYCQEDTARELVRELTWWKARKKAKVAA